MFNGTTTDTSGMRAKARRALGLKLPAQRDVGAETPHLALCHQADAERRLAPQRLGAALPQAGGGAAGKACKMSRARQCGAELLQRNRAPPGFWGYFLLAYGLSLSGFHRRPTRTIYTLRTFQALCRHGSPPCFAKISLRCRRRNCAVPSYDAARPGRMRRPRGPRRPPRAAPVMCAFTAPQ